MKAAARKRRPAAAVSEDCELAANCPLAIPGGHFGPRSLEIGLTPPIRRDFPFPLSCIVPPGRPMIEGRA